MRWDGKKVLSYKTQDNVKSNDIVLWENYTEACYRNITVKSPNGRTVYFSGMPDDVKTPAVAPQWTSFGAGDFSLVKDDAANMNYSQKITSSADFSGVYQGPQAVRSGDMFEGYIYAKGDGVLQVGLMHDGKWIASSELGRQGRDWAKHEFSFGAGSYQGDADFVIAVRGGSVQVDEVSLTTQKGKELGGFRPDIFNAVKDLHPTCLRWPGGGYVAQDDWKWGIGPQEKRQRWDHWMWMDYDQNAFGTDEFIRFCREINTEPVIVVSVGFERPASEYESLIQNACDLFSRDKVH